MKIIDAMNLKMISGAGYVKMTDNSLYLTYGTDLELSFGGLNVTFNSDGDIANLTKNESCTLSDGVPVYIEGYGFITGSRGNDGYSYLWTA